MLKKKLTLVLLSILLLTGFFLLPQNRKWAGKVLSYYQEFPEQTKKLDRETRMEERLGNSYKISKVIAETFRNNSPEPDAVVLIPPTNYFKQVGAEYHVPEPAVFYYYTGMKTIWADSKEAINVNWYLRVQDRNMVFVNVVDKQDFQDTINAFRKLKPAL